MLPPPAESLYSLPRRLPTQPQPSTKVTPIAVGSNSAGATASNSLSTEQLIASKLPPTLLGLHKVILGWVGWVRFASEAASTKPSTKVTPIAVGSYSASATASNSLSTEQLIASK